MTHTSVDHNRLAQAATEARGLAIDAVSKCKSGHLGLPLGTAEIGASLFGKLLQFNPKEPNWLNRDRFILSAGHGSMFLYSWLHLSGFDISLEEVKNFRVLNSITPGHPEHETVGVECTTGPLGQGIGNAVGMAVAAKKAQATFNTHEHTLFDHAVVALCGDGCLQEGVASESIALAGHWGLDNLILIYDSNDVTLDAMADATQSGDIEARFQSYNFDTEVIDGHNMQAFEKAYTKAKANKNGRPKIIIAKTTIGKGISEVEGSFKAHGEAGVKFADTARQALGLPEEHFYISDEVKEYFANRTQERVKDYEAWQTLFNEWKEANPELAKLLEQGLHQEIPANLINDVPQFETDAKLATRASGETILNAIAEKMPLLLSGSADLHGSTKNYIKDGKNFSHNCPEGRNFLFGIREHAMGAIVNGFGYYGIFKASGATFLVFSDYLRPSIRLAALGHLPIFHIFTHDSVAVGEDGPTHQPVETVSALRVIPGLDVIRSADPEETVGAFVAAVSKKEGPTVLALTRQSVPMLNQIPVQMRREGVLKGAYIARKEQGNLKLILMASGSELQHALNTAEKLGPDVRVVSMPCFERFDQQPQSYKDQILPSSCKHRIAIEAGVSNLWYKYVGLEGKVVGIDRFGLSAPGATVLKELGISEENLLKIAKSF